MSNECKGAEGVEKPKLPPEVLQRIREALAVGIARNFINKALQELQTNCEAVEA